MSKRKKHAKKSKRTEKEDRSLKRKGAKIARCLMVKYQAVEINFILFIEKLLEAFFCFSSISVYSLGGPIVQISIYFFYEIYLLLFTPLQLDCFNQKKNLSEPQTSIYGSGVVFFFLPGCAVIYPLSCSTSNKALGSSKCSVET